MAKAPPTGPSSPTKMIKIEKLRAKRTDWRLTKSLVEIVATRNSNKVASTAVFAVQGVDESGEFGLVGFIFAKRHDVKVDLLGV